MQTCRYTAYSPGYMPLLLKGQKAGQNGLLLNSLLCCLDICLLIDNPFALINGLKYFPLTTAMLNTRGGLCAVDYPSYNRGDILKNDCVCAVHLPY